MSSANALTQYLELYAHQAETIDRGSSEVLNRLRPAALEALQGARLPRRGDEGYEKTSVEDMFAPNYGINLGRMALNPQSGGWLRCAVSHLSTLSASTVGDEFRPSKGLEERLPEGVKFMSLRRAASEYPELVAKYYGTLAPLKESIVALNTLFAQDGVFIHVDRGVHVAKPLQLINLFPEGCDTLAFRRILLVAEEGAEVKFLTCDHTRDEERHYLSSVVTEVFIGKNASVEIYDMEESSTQTGRVSRLYARQESDSRLRTTAISLTAGITRNDFDIDLCGKGCDTFLSGMAILTGTMHVDNDTQVRHHAERCHSDQLFKYVVDDNASGAFEGSILVDYGARLTEAFQTNRNILASKKATMHSKPGLEIYNDDVKCSHGATTGQLDSKALFYMQTRGIPREEARRMLMQAFMSDVIETVGFEELRDRLHHLVNRRFADEADQLCQTCRQ